MEKINKKSSVREFFFPCSVIEPYQEEQAAKKENIKNNIADRNFFIDKKKAEVNTKSHVQHEPEQAKKKRRDNPLQKIFYFRFKVVHCLVKNFLQVKRKSD
jgi:hypothetical protein